MAKTKRFPRKQASDVSVHRIGIATGLSVTIAFVVIFSALGFSGQAADKQSASNDPKAIQADSQPSASIHRSRKLQSSRTGAGQLAARKPVARRVPSTSNAAGDHVALLRQLLTQQQLQIAAQQKQIAELRGAIEEQKHLLEAATKGSQAETLQARNLDQVATLLPVIPAAAPATTKGDAVPAPAPRSPRPEAVTQDQMQGYVQRVDQLSKVVDTTITSLAGFKLGGDFRLRLDAAVRASNSFAGPYQNVRGNYRMRFNLDKALNDQISFHLQLGSGLANNPLTYNTGFGGFAARGPLFIGEAWASYHSNSNLDLLGGRIPELFADDSRFLFKEDIRFDGFQENFKIPAGSNPLGITRVELRAGQYILTNPNVPVLPSAKACAAAPAQVITKLPATIITAAALPTNCAYLSAGYLPGGKVRDADLFHQGFAVFGDLKPGWHHLFVLDVQWYRNQNQIALAATAAGAPLVVGAIYGTSSFLPITGTGTATTTPGGATFTAPHFQVAHVKYRIGYDGWKVKDHEMPAYLEFHAARNVGTSFLNNAVMGIASFGDTKKAGDVRLLYGYAIKEGNSMISEVTDDYLGTNTSVNMRTHEIRFDVGLSRFLAWQNYLYIQNEISGNDAARHFFVPIPTGTATQYRLQSQLQFKF
jgi:putative porin